MYAPRIYLVVAALILASAIASTSQAKLLTDIYADADAIGATSDIGR